MDGKAASGHNHDSSYASASHDHDSSYAPIDLAGTGRTIETVKGNADDLKTHLADTAPHKAAMELDEYITRDISGKITKYELKSGSTVKYTENIIRDSQGKVTGYAEMADGVTITSTINRGSDGKISTITKAVS